MTDTLFLIDTVIILAAAVFSVLLFKRLNLEPVLGYLIAGALVGPYSLGLVGNVNSVSALAERGVVFLLFTIGLELPLERLKILGARMYALGLAQLAFTAAIVTAIAALAGLPTNAAIVVGVTLSLSSTVFVVQLLLDRGELKTRLGRTAFAVLVIQDIVVGPFLVIVLAMGDTSVPIGTSLAMAGGKAALTLLAIFLIGRTILRPVFRFAAIAHNNEVFAATTLLVVLCTAVLTHTVGLSLALGGLLAGILLAETEYRHQVAAEILPFRGLLLGLFFMTVGMSVDLGLALDNLSTVLLLAAAIIVGKATILSTIAIAFGLPRRISFPLGALLAQGGEFAFVLFGVAMVQGVLPKETGQVLIVAVAITLLLSPLLSTLSGVVSRRSKHSADIGVEEIQSDDISLKDHVIIAGYGRVGRTVALRLLSQDISVVAVDLDPDTVMAGRQARGPVYFGDATRPDILEALNITEARALVVALPNAQAAIRLVGLIHYLLPDLAIFARAHDEEHAAALEKVGALIVVPELIATGERLASALLEDQETV